MAGEITVAREGGVAPLNGIRNGSSSRRPSSNAKRAGKRSTRLYPDLRARDIVETSETFEGGGSLVVTAERTNEGLASRSNMDVYLKEKQMSRILAKNGHQVVLRQSGKSGETYDITIDGKPADLKWVKSPKYMLAHAHKATTQQGAETTIFMLDGKWRKFRSKLIELSDNGYHGIYMVKGSDKLYTY